MFARPILVTLALACAAAFGTGCGKSIGDECSTNVDCSISGDRFCDTAPPGGYCTVEGCDVDSCPGDSVCVRFYTPIQTEPCVYDYSYPRGTCAADQRCVSDQTADGVTATTAHCAPENSERRWCMARCGKNADCRSGYECRTTGTLGAEPVPSLSNPQGENAMFCVSSGQSS